MRYFIHLAYNGANYYGWQTQPDLPTVQLTLEQALSTLLRNPIAIVGCGRTDTGVHASDFYAHFTIEQPINCPQLRMGVYHPQQQIFAQYGTLSDGDAA